MFQFHSRQPESGLLGFLLQPFHRRRRLFWLGGQQHGNSPVLVFHFIGKAERPAAAHHFQLSAAPVSLRGNQHNLADFPRSRHMNSAAGADIRARIGDDPHISLQLLFAAVRDFFQLLRIRPADLHPMILPYIPVGLQFQLLQILRRNLPVKIDDDHFRPHMKSHIIAAVFLMNHAADNMLPGMLLHQVKPPLPVDDPMHRRSLRKRRFHRMPDFSLLLLHIRHRNLIQRSQIAGLSSSLRVKYRPVQPNLIPFFCPAALQHRAVKLLLISISIK